MSELTTNNIPVGVGNDSNGDPKGLVELSSISVSSLSATDLYADDLHLNGSSIYIRDGDTLLIYGSISAVDYLGVSGGGGSASLPTASVDRTSLVSEGGTWVASGPVEVSSTSPDNAIGKLWLDTSETASGIDSLAVKSITASYSVVASDSLILADATGGAIIVSLTPAGDKTGKVYNIKKIDSSNSVTIDGDNSETIDGQTTQVLTTQYDSITVVSDGSNWHII